MPRKALLLFLAALCAQQIAAQAVFAHVIVGNTAAYTLETWKSDIKLAASKGIDAFVLNIAPPLEGTVLEQSALAFEAANSLANGFKLFFSFDYLGSGIPWATEDIVALLHRYCRNRAHYRHNGRLFVSTFEGPTNSDVGQWATIREKIPGGIYFVPDWTSQGLGFETSLYDGAFSWNMWPKGPENMTVNEDRAWQTSLKRSSKSYMMGVSPWFYTDLPAYNKAWVWRGDGMWSQRWHQVMEILPEFVEIVTWNDYGESHYVGPIHPPGIPQAEDADARPYVHHRPHQAWLETLPYQIAAYKHAFHRSNPAPSVRPGEDKVVFWYRNAPASAGRTRATGNSCISSINTSPQDETRYPVDEILEDSVFIIALLSSPGWVSVAIGHNPPHRFEGLGAGINYISRPFDRQFGKVVGIALMQTLATGIRGGTMGNIMLDQS
ncbi:Glucan endo-1,3-alpha-glucosidase agn1 [Saxophila tyrrhenica]|uniref:Glucan endo-1,3-alpha-glucosidase agn1 n=1 Tax=Saxophila tyrrhenica TaxID=1690608 RepID=A0AAV9NVV8_9PEZI|nr:Glucan endo-1,3-alpha-glucosidase agn1 [Saxophila tyrrhenica]